MKKYDLIKKARERGITIDETQAEKYITLSDEELANLEISGGCGPDKDTTIDKHNCPRGVKQYYRYKGTEACSYCGYMDITHGNMVTYYACKHNG
jgi:hypothetical protein